MGRTSTCRTSRATGALTIAFAAALAALLAGCAAGDDDAGDGMPVDGAFEVTAETATADMAAGGADIGGDGAGAVADLDLGVIGRDVAIEMHVVLGSDDIERSVATITARAAALGGGVASSDVRFGSDGGDGRDGHAVLVVKVPPETLDRLIGTLGETATVRSINQSAEDVHDQLVDLDVRIANARESVANVRDFMSRTGNLTDLVTLERELTVRQTELEQLEARQRTLSDRVALSTVTIEIVPTGAVPAEEDGPDSISEAFADGWEAFVGLARGIVIVVAVLAPFLGAAMILGGLAWAVRRRQRPGPRPTAAPNPEVADEDAVSEELVSASREG